MTCKGRPGARSTAGILGVGFQRPAVQAAAIGGDRNPKTNRVFRARFHTVSAAKQKPFSSLEKDS
jgi:hypothetical protein